MHETDVSKTEIIDILGFQKESLKPEQIINNALRLEQAYAERLLSMAMDSEQPVDLDNLSIEPSNIESPNIKIMLLRYFGILKEAGAARIIGKFLADSNKTVVIEALKALKALTVSFDASVVLPFIETMSEIEREMALDIIIKQANSDLIPKLAP